MWQRLKTSRLTNRGTGENGTAPVLTAVGGRNVGGRPHAHAHTPIANLILPYHPRNRNHAHTKQAKPARTSMLRTDPLPGEIEPGNAPAHPQPQNPCGVRQTLISKWAARESGRVCATLETVQPAAAPKARRYRIDHWIAGGRLPHERHLTSLRNTPLAARLCFAHIHCLVRPNKTAVRTTRGSADPSHFQLTRDGERDPSRWPVRFAQTPKLLPLIAPRVLRQLLHKAP